MQNKITLTGGILIIFILSLLVNLLPAEARYVVNRDGELIYDDYREFPTKTWGHDKSEKDYGPKLSKDNYKNLGTPQSPKSISIKPVSSIEVENDCLKNPLKCLKGKLQKR